MSGGSYEYRYRTIESLAHDIRYKKDDYNDLRKPFAHLLEMCAKAAKAIEWVDSGDYPEGGDADDILAALSCAGDEYMTRFYQKKADIIEELESVICSIKEIHKPEVSK